MDKYYVYILYSVKIDKYYVGYSRTPEKRLVFHNSSFNKIWSKKGQPWELKTTIPFASKTEAMVVERKIKSFKSRTAIESIINKGWKG
ncbi:GIY-YIG nuclease family protein [Marivirga sp. S37H4]|uniref:GIY-YIG nuclease family protein n=1 Tax=Marivirga aurantiaca TaxID=2802615 RepID=A0A934WZ91_9BACT|nr:GIY-YIG nuclease family protein [Marivirga aurantiaca]MBK6265742.1 GIY-YIG nuclease family protein [Marivirga aurantiaca]MBK6265743.1 GIY-YIG nuclease family protein [Marivirga aurantiaca]MBK6265744.1 GIY-YIG nuclease family protein [Marivirga aurantiaca]